MPGSRQSRESALRYNPTVLLARMMLASVLEKEDLAKEAGQRDAAVHARAAHWRWYDLDRLPDDPKLWARAAKILRQLPEARVGVGPKPITAAEAAEQALKKAGTEGLGFRLLTFSVTTGWKPIPLARNRKSNGKNGLPSGA